MYQVGLQSNDFTGLCRRLLDAMHAGVYVVDTQRVIRYWNDAAERIAGYSRAEVVGRRCQDNLLAHVDGSGCQLCLAGCPLQETMLDGEPREASLYLRHRDGSRRPVLVRTGRILDAEGRTIGGVEIFWDNSATLAMLERIQHLEDMAYVDPLTGLANRRYLEVALQGRLDELSRYGWPFAVLLIDLDDFKSVNDSCGHLVGDQVLKMVAKTLSHNMRSFDVVGRWGGDEFLVLLPSVEQEALMSIAERWRLLVESGSLPGPDGPVRIKMSAGGLVAQPEDTYESLLAKADALLYRSKVGGRNRITLE